MDDADNGFEQFARDRAAPLLRYGYVLAGNPHDAADLVQEALARVGLKWARVGSEGNPEAYTRVVMARLHISRWRRTRREHLTADVPEQGYTDGGFDRADDADPMWQVLARLAPRQRAVLVLRYYEQHTDDEIAQILGVSRVTVRTQASRALAKLRLEHAPSLSERAV